MDEVQRPQHFAGVRPAARPREELQLGDRAGVGGPAPGRQVSSQQSSFITLVRGRNKTNPRFLKRDSSIKEQERNDVSFRLQL